MCILEVMKCKWAHLKKKKKKKEEKWEKQRRNKDINIFKKKIKIKQSRGQVAFWRARTNHRAKQLLKQKKWNFCRCKCLDKWRAKQDRLRFKWLQPSDMRGSQIQRCGNGEALVAYLWSEYNKCTV